MSDDSTPLEDGELIFDPEGIFEMGEGGAQRPRESVGSRLMDPDSDVEEIDETADVVGVEAEDADWVLAPEEAAIHVVSEDAADDVDPAIERAEYLEGR
jgi:hypothetical protein